MYNHVQLALYHSDLIFQGWLVKLAFGAAFSWARRNNKGPYISSHVHVAAQYFLTCAAPSLDAGYLANAQLA